MNKPLKRTDGHRALVKWMVQTKRSRAAVARIAGTSPASVSQWLSKSSVPDAVSRMILAEVAGIPLDAWLGVSERRRLSAGVIARPST